MNNVKIFILLISLLPMIAINCSSKQTGGTIETTNGAIAGKIVDNISPVPASSVIMVIPHDFDPTTQSTDIITTDTIDKDGFFEISNLNPNIYNVEVISIDKNLKTFYKGVEVSDSKKDIDTLVLNHTGFLHITDIPDSFSFDGEFYIEGTHYKWTRDEIASNNSVLIPNLPASNIPSIKFRQNSNSTFLTSNLSIPVNDTLKITPFSFFNKMIYLPSNRITSLSADEMGRIWFGTIDSGYVIYDEGIWQNGKVGITSVITNNHITVFESYVNMNKDSITWIGTIDGLVQKKGRGYTYPLYTDQTSLLPSNNIRSIDFDGMNGVWIGTDSGLVHFNGSTWKVHTVPLSSKDITNCKLDNNNVLWVGNSSGLARFSGSNLVEVLTKPVICMERLNLADELWIAHDDGLISISDNGNSITKTIQSEYSIQAIFEGSDGTTYIGTSRGLQLFSNNKLSDINPGTFIECEGHSITSIIEDQKGNLWFGTENNGIIIFGPSASNISYPE